MCTIHIYTEGMKKDEKIEQISISSSLSMSPIAGNSSIPRLELPSSSPRRERTSPAHPVSFALVFALRYHIRIEVC
jgi:hypothetical protein